MATADRGAPGSGGAAASLSVPSAPDAKGGVTVGSGVGSAEVTLLVTRELNQAAREIARQVRAVHHGPVVVFCGEPKLDFTALDRFDSVSGLLSNALADLLARTPPAPPGPGAGTRDISLVSGSPPPPGATRSIAAALAAANPIGAVLSAAAVAAQYFAIKTKLDAVTLTAQDSVLAAAVAGALLRADRRKSEVRPGVAVAPVGTRRAALAVMQQLQDLLDQARQAEHLAADLSAAGDTAGSQTAAAAASAARDFAAALMKADGGSPAIDAVIAQWALRDRLKTGAALYVRVVAEGGTLTSREGVFLNIAGGANTHAFAMAVVGYTLLAGEDHDVIAAGVLGSPSRHVELANVAEVADDVMERVDHYNQYGGERPHDAQPAAAARTW
ncbi:MAG: hypothetical protein RQ833_08215 [Sphingomonadaceae bacterium]|nr:hypothetical protein [Sphingomonadaceae bacterium]